MNVWVTHHICHIWSPHHLLWKPLKKNQKSPPHPKKNTFASFLLLLLCTLVWSFIFRMGLCIRMNLGGPDFLSFAPPSHMFWKSFIYFKLWQHTTTSDVNKKQVHQILSRFLATEEKSWITCCNTSIQPPNTKMLEIAVPCFANWKRWWEKIESKKLMQLVGFQVFMTQIFSHKWKLV